VGAVRRGTEPPVSKAKMWTALCLCHFISHPSGFQTKERFLPTRRGEKPKSRVGKIPRYSMLYWWSRCFRFVLIACCETFNCIAKLVKSGHPAGRQKLTCLKGLVVYIYILIPPFIYVPPSRVLLLFPFLLGHFWRPFFNDV